MNTPITSRENLKRALRGEELWTPVASEFLQIAPRIIPDNVARGFVMDMNPIDNDTEAGGPDMFGVIWEWVPQVFGSMVRAEGPQKLGDISEWESTLTFPDPATWDWEGSARDNAESRDKARPLMASFLNGLFERLISLLGFENAAVALVDDEKKPYVHAFFEKLCDLYEDIFALFRKYYEVDGIYFHDDWGGQYSPFFSPDTVREMILPYLKRLADFAHARGMFLDFHSCGKNEMLVPVMIEAGIDMWSGQALNDMVALLEKYAGKIRFEIEPGFEFGKSYTDEEIASITQEALEIYEPYLDSILMRAMFVGEIPFEMTYAASREKFAGRA